MSPTARTLLYLRKQGYLAATVERYHAYAKVRMDLFQWIDVIAVKESVWAIQVCAMGSRTTRLEKIQSPAIAPKVWRWLHAGGRASLIAVTRHVRAGAKRAKWSLSETELLPDGQDRIVGSGIKPLTARPAPARSSPTAPRRSGRRRTTDVPGRATRSSASGSRGSGRDRRPSSGRAPAAWRAFVGFPEAYPGPYAPPATAPPSAQAT